MTERQNEALRRLLADASAGGQAKVDAMVALAQRTLWVVPWEGVEGYRTLVNSTGLAALPVFTTAAELHEAAQRFGWLTPEGTVGHKEIGARAAFGYAHEKSLGFVVVDITSEHSLEISRDELAPLLAQSRPGRVESSLMAAVARRSEPGMPAVRAPTPAPGTLGAVRAPTPAPGSLGAARPPTPPGGVPITRGSSPGTLPVLSPPTPSSGVTIPTSLPAGALPPRSESKPDAGPAYPDATAQIIASTRLFPPGSTPEDALLDRLEALLRGYPEVEWACIGSANAHPALGLRIDQRMRKRLDALADAVAKASGLAVVTLDDPAHFKAAKSEAFVFFPWRR